METSAGTDLSVATTGPNSKQLLDPTPQKKPATPNEPTWKFYTFIVLPLSICLITLFSVSIWKSLRDLDAQRVLNCPSIDGNNDMYGLGIRLGVYMQLTASAFVDTFGNQQYSSGLVASTLWFLLALSVASGMELSDPNTQSSELYIIVSLGNAVTTVLLSKLFKIDPLKSTESCLLYIGRFVLWGVWRATTSMYWFSILYSYVQGSDGCGTWGWIFFKVDLNGSFRTYNQIITMAEWVILSLLLLAFIIGAIIFCVSLCIINPDLGEGHAQVGRFGIAWDYLFAEIGQVRLILRKLVSRAWRALVSDNYFLLFFVLDLYLETLHPTSDILLFN